MLCSDYTVTSFCFLTKRFFSNNTGINVLDIIAVIFLSLAISRVGKILSYLKVGPQNIVLIGIWPAIEKVLSRRSVNIIFHVFDLTRQKN